MRIQIIVLSLWVMAVVSISYAQTPLLAEYKGIISKSDSRKDGEQFVFAHLSTQRPFVTFPSGNGAETSKVFENSEITVLIFVADATGSTETFYLNKKAKRFTLIEVCAPEATVIKSEFKPKVSYGKLQ